MPDNHNVLLSKEIIRYHSSFIKLEARKSDNRKIFSFCVLLEFMISHAKITNSSKSQSSRFRSVFVKFYEFFFDLCLSELGMG